MGLLDRIRERAVAGEQSRLREEFSIGLLFGQSYSLRSSKVNYELARQLYRNEHDSYKLGAWPAKPVINTTAGFMGAPRFTHAAKDEEVQGVLDVGINTWKTKLLRLMRELARDGDSYARLSLEQSRFDRDDVDFAMSLIPPEWVEPTWDPITGELKECLIAYPIKQRVLDEGGKYVRTLADYKIIEILRPNERRLSTDGNAPEEVKRELAERELREATDNRWGFIPIVPFRNEGERQSLFGQSDLEPIEPFMKAYHDLMLFSIQGAKTIARPKVKIAVKNVKEFLSRNFTPEEVKEGKLSFQNRELFIAEQGDEIEFIVADTGLAGISTLLEFLFYCVVDISETPEFAFGTAVASSKASVSEQMPIFTRRIERKRGENEDPLAEYSSMFLAMAAQVGAFAKPDTYRTEVDWDEVTPKDDQTTATTIVTVIDAMLAGVEGGLVSLTAAIDFIKEFVPTMLPAETESAEPDEIERIKEGLAKLREIQDTQAGENTPEPPQLRPVPEPAEA